MKLLITVFILFTSTVNLYAFSLSGKVIDNKSQKPVEGITVAIEELKIVKYTDKNGNFIFNKIKPGKYKLYLSSVAYGQKVFKIKLKRNFYIEFEIEKNIYKLKKIKNSYFKKEDRFGSQKINNKEIQEFPMRGVGDSLHLLQTLPGIGGGFSFASVPIIRGGNPLYDKYYLDDIALDYPYHFVASIIPLFSSINQEIISEVSVIKSLSPMYYDDNLGNVVQIKTKEVEEAGFHGKVSIDPILPTVYATIVPRPEMSIMCAGRRSTIDLLTDFEEKSGYFQDYYAKINYHLYENHKISFITFGANDSLDYEELKSKSSHHVEAVKWEFLLNRKTFLKTILTRYGIDNSIKDDDVNTSTGESGVSLQYNPLQYKIFQMLNYTQKKFYTKTGYEIVRHKNGVESNIDLSDLPDNEIFDQFSDSSIIDSEIEGTSYSVFSENGYEFKNMWINLGARYKYYGPENNNSLSMRALYGIYINSNNVLYFGTGVYHAHADVYYYIGETETDFKDSQAYNSNMGLKSRLNKNIFSQIEIYYSKYKNLTVANTNIIDVSDYKRLTQLHPYANETEGNTYGLEMFIKGSYKKYYGWISYAYSVSKRSNDQNNIDDFYSDFDQRHILRIACAAKYGKWIPALIWHYYSSLPYTSIDSATYNNDEYNANYGEYNSSRFAMNHRLDFKITYNYTENFKFFAEVWNIYLNRKNNVYQSFDQDEPYSDENPESVSDIPIFVWMGMELCF